MIPGGLYLADTSAIARSRHPRVAEELGRLGRQGLFSTCVTIDLEVLYSARSPEEYAEIAHLRAVGFTDLPLNHDISRRARQIQAAMAKTGRHRAAGVFDVLTAAVAGHHAAIVLHYDRDFDHVASVTGQPTRWVVPPGSID